MALLGKSVEVEGWCSPGRREGHGWKPRGGYLETDGESEDRITSPRFLT